MTSDYLHEHAAPFRLAADGPEAVLLLHGWTGTPAYFRMLGSSLHGAGYTVVAPLYPGHGTQVEDMPGTTWKDWVGAATEELLLLHESHEDVHLVRENKRQSGVAVDAGLGSI